MNKIEIILRDALYALHDDFAFAKNKMPPIVHEPDVLGIAQRVVVFPRPIDRRQFIIGSILIGDILARIIPYHILEEPFELRVIRLQALPCKRSTHVDRGQNVILKKDVFLVVAYQYFQRNAHNSLPRDRPRYLYL